MIILVVKQLSFEHQAQQSATRKLPIGSAAWLCERRKSPFEARGLTSLLHSWLVLRTTQSVVSHSWNVAQWVESSEVAHSWNVATETGGDLPHVWRVVRPELVILHGKDIQLPYGTGVVTPGG